MRMMRSGRSPYGGIATRSNPPLYPSITTSAEAYSPGGVVFVDGKSWCSNDKKGLIVLIERDLQYLCTHETVGDIWKHLS